MDIGESLTVEKLEEVIDKLVKPKIYVNKESFNAIVSHLGYEPKNLVVMAYVSKNTALILNDERINYPLILE